MSDAYVLQASGCLLEWYIFSIKKVSRSHLSTFEILLFFL